MYHISVLNRTHTPNDTFLRRYTVLENVPLPYFPRDTFDSQQGCEELSATQPDDLMTSQENTQWIV